VKKIFCKIFLCVFLAFFLSGCANKDDRTVIKFSSWGSKSEIDIIKPIIAEFEAENSDVKVEFMHIPQNYFQKIHLLFASNTPPDVIFINNLYLPIYANAGVLEPVSDWADLSLYENNVLASLSWKSDIYAVPRDVSNLVIFYNKDLFDKFGIKYPDKNWTYKDLIEIGEKFKQNGVFAISFEEAPLFFLPYLMSEGGGIVKNSEGELSIYGEASQRGLNFYSDLRKKYHIAPYSEESASATMAQMFLQQKLAMHLTGRWLVPKYREEANFNWDIVSFPNGSVGSIVPLDASGWAVSNASKHKEEAHRFVNYLSSKSSIEKLTQCGLIVPARKDVANSKYFLDGKNPHNALVFLDVIKSAQPTPVPVNYNEILDNLSNYFEEKFN